MGNPTKMKIWCSYHRDILCLRLKTQNIWIVQMTGTQLDALMSSGCKGAWDLIGHQVPGLDIG